MGAVAGVGGVADGRFGERIGVPGGERTAAAGAVVGALGVTAGEAARVDEEVAGVVEAGTE